MVLYTLARYKAGIRLAPALTLVYAVSALSTPPTPITGIRRFAARKVCANFCVESSKRGAPLRPPGSSCLASKRFLGRVVVVLETIIPEIPLDTATSTISWMSSFVKSGAIFRSKGSGRFGSLFFNEALINVFKSSSSFSTC